MEASALRQASRRGLLARRSPLLRLERDERLVALIRAGHDRAFEVLFNRYQQRLLSFCNSMLKSPEDAEDVLQEVFVNAHKAMLADERRINLRPWLYRIARNRCLNHLRRPVHEGQDSMDVHPHLNGTTTAERVQKREELRHVLSDVRTLPETQRTALLLREIEQLSYEEIAVTMDTTIPAVKSLLVRARIALAESSEARTLSCDEVRLSLAEAAEGVARADGPVRMHVKACEQCRSFRDQLRQDGKALSALVPFAPLVALKAGLLAKLLGGGGATAGGGAAAGGGGAAPAAGAGALGTLGGTVAAGAGGTTVGGLGALGGAIGGKAAAGIATAALLTAGAVEVRKATHRDPTPPPAIERAVEPSGAAAASRTAPIGVPASERLQPPKAAEPDGAAEDGPATPAPAATPDPAPAPAGNDEAESDEEETVEVEEQGKPPPADSQAKGSGGGCEAQEEPVPSEDPLLSPPPPVPPDDEAAAPEKEPAPAEEPAPEQDPRPAPCA